MYTSTEAATALGVTRQTVARYVRQGLIEAEFVGLNHAVRIAEAALIAFAQKHGISLRLSHKFGQSQ